MLMGTMRITHRPALRALALAAAGLLTAAALAACAPTVETRGNLPPPERLAQIRPGQQTRDQVAQILGTPSTLSAFGDPTWYYISYRTETTAFFRPEEVDRTVVAVDFDGGGRVQAVRTLGLEDGREVEFADRETPTAGKELTILQQFLGNLGRFSGSKDNWDSGIHR